MAQVAPYLADLAFRKRVSDLVDLLNGGTTDQVLTKDSATDGDYGWADVPTELPAGGSTGDILYKTAGGYGWTTVYTRTVFDGDYESGSFSPTIDGATGYTTQVGLYERWGDMVMWQAYIEPSGMTGSGTCFIRSLPFTAKNTTSAFWPAAVWEMENITNGEQVRAAVDPNSTTCRLVRTRSGTTGVNLNITDVSAGSIIVAGGTYRRD